MLEFFLGLIVALDFAFVTTMLVICIKFFLKK